ncbi:MAG: DUF3419 family protein [Saprospiraceae bacterium]|nr:DUF3419 family protein [Saprospiraceae bacterium]
MSKLKDIRHDYLRYANVWEDAEVLKAGLQAKPGERHLSIASGGDNAFFLLTSNPELIVAVDINQPQLFLCALKQSAIKHLDRQAYLEFLGFLPSNNRLQIFNRLAPGMQPEAAAFWAENTVLIEAGLVQCGKFERYFRLFSKWILPCIHSKNDVRKLLEPKSAEAQTEYYHRHWNTWRWRWLFKIFFSRPVMGWAGRDPAFFNEVEVVVGQHIFDKAARHLCSMGAQQNHILHFNLTGHFGDRLPDYVKPGIYEHIQSNIDRLQFHHGFAEAAIEKWGKFDCFNLSNIFEYMDRETFKAVADQLMQGANIGARFGYWNLMVPRNMADLYPERLQDETERSMELGLKDRGFFYNRFVINTLLK